MEQLEVRMAKTESLFRDVNERLAESAPAEAEETSFVCECGDPECTQRVEAPLEEYEEVRAEATQFLLVPGHEDERVEKVVEQRRRYNVVRKVNDVVAAWARRLDPRAGAA
jgi:hypothetical protein